MLGAQHFKSAMPQQRFEIGQPEVDQVPRHVNPVPAFAQQQELPASRVGYLNDQTPIRPQQLVRRVQVTGRIVQMFQHVEHGHRGAASGRKRRAGERRAHRRNPGAPPRDIGGIQRKIEPGHAYVAPLRQHLQEQPAAAAYVDIQSLFFRFVERPLHEMQMIAQNEPPILLLQHIRRRSFRNVPIMRRIIIP